MLWIKYGDWRYFTLAPTMALVHYLRVLIMREIVWPEGYLPGFTENFVSNEIIVAGLTAADVWPLLSHAARANALS